MRELLEMFWAFCTIGALTFGGGYSMLPMLTRVTVEKHHWTTEEDLLNYFAIGQCTPGLIAVNTAIFIGYKQKKFPGALACALGVIVPSIIIILVIAMVLENLMHLTFINYAFAGIRLAVGALIVSTIIKLCKSSTRNLVQILLCVAAFVMVAVLGFSPIWVVLGASIVGLILREGVEAK